MYACVSVFVLVFVVRVCVCVYLYVSMSVCHSVSVRVISISSLHIKATLIDISSPLSHSVAAVTTVATSLADSLTYLTQPLPPPTTLHIPAFLYV